MWHFPVILFLLAGLTGHCLAAGEQAADNGESTTQVAKPGTGAAAGKQQGKKANSVKKQSAGGEEEPDCD